MDRIQLEKDHPILEKIVSGFMVIPDIVFIAVDIFQVPVRDWMIPKAVKRKFDWLSCRTTDYYGNIFCEPVHKYYHKSLFQCKYYDPKSDHCRKYKNKHEKQKTYK